MASENGTPYNGPTFPLQTLLELACAAQRVNKEYRKDLEAVYGDGDQVGTVLYYKFPNRQLIS